MTYDQFLERKTPVSHRAGFAPTVALNPMLFDWQQKIVTWALRLGRAAIFADCGLGKTPQQLEWANQIAFHTGERVLILAPLAVAQQTEKEGRKFGIACRRVREPDEIQDSDRIIVTNYDRAHKFEMGFGGVVLDESSVLKDETSKTKEYLTTRFASTPYRLCCTATPAPNDYTEIGTTAEFLGICSHNEMLATYFVHDSAHTSEWRLKRHAVKDFWRWVTTWAMCVTKPSDIGGDDSGFVLPEMVIDTHPVDVDRTSDNPEELFRMPSMSGTTMHAEMRKTAEDRAQAAAEIARAHPGEPIVIWCNTNYEADALKKVLPEAEEIRGSDDIDWKEDALDKFSQSKDGWLISKPSLTGHGLNWQHCARQIFVGLSYSFEQFYQATRRSHRFGQKRPVIVHMIYATTEGAVKVALEKKMAAHNQMKTEMMEAAIQMQMTGKAKKVSMQTEIHSVSGQNWTLHHGDCNRVMEKMGDESVDFSVYSPPFHSLYTYSDDVQDLGNCGDIDEFMEQYGFIIRQLFRITAPGRLSVVHCCDLPLQKWKDGVIAFTDFSGRIIQEHAAAGWIMHSPRVTIWKDPVVEMQRTKALGLLHKQLKKDSIMSRVGNPDYLLVFRKPGENGEPVMHTKETYPVEQWQKDASPVWMDIDQGDVLNYAEARDQRDERHICPLQLQVIRRALRLWSNEGDTVCSPFAGIGSEGVASIEMKRKFVGCELKKSYFEQAVAYLRRTEAESASLFD